MTLYRLLKNTIKTYRQDKAVDDPRNEFANVKWRTSDFLRHKLYEELTSYDRRVMFENNISHMEVFVSPTLEEVKMAYNIALGIIEDDDYHEEIHEFDFKKQTLEDVHQGQADEIFIYKTMLNMNELFVRVRFHFELGYYDKIETIFLDEQQQGQTLQEAGYTAGGIHPQEQHPVL